MSKLPKKVSQDDLRRIMQSHKQQQQNINQITSPLAKYLDNGFIMCILCKTTIKSSQIWKVHVNSSKHQQNIQITKQLQQNLLKTEPIKRQSTTPIQDQHDRPEKKIKGILKNSQSNATVASSTVPTDFFDLGEQTLSKETKKVNIEEPMESSVPVAVEESENAVGKETKKEVDETLPEGFFDDPILDAKVRNVQYKDPMEEEWEKFQKEMKEESSTSAAIIAGEHEEATAERQIDEIDEQMRNWLRVLDLERKKEDAKKLKDKESSENMDVQETGNSDDEEFDEFLDWRAKKSFR